MTDRLTRAVVGRLAELRTIANVIRSAIVEDSASMVTFSAMGAAIAGSLDRVQSPRLYRDIGQACRLLGLRTSKAHNHVTVIRGVRLK